MYVTTYCDGAGLRWGELADKIVRPSLRGPVDSGLRLVSAAGFEPATHALKGSPTQLQTTTCTSSLLHARHNKIHEMPTRHRSGCPEGARNPASRKMSLRCIGSFVSRRNHFAEPSSISAAYVFQKSPETYR